VRQLTTVAERVNRSGADAQPLGYISDLEQALNGSGNGKKIRGQQGDKILVKHATSLQAVGLGAGIYPEGKRRLGIG